MIISLTVSEQIIAHAKAYIGRPFNYESFNCVHFVIEVYRCVGIELPFLDRNSFPPPEFNLSEEELIDMPLGHCAFFKRKNSTLNRPWTHVALVFSNKELIHCTRRFGGKVVVTPLQQFLEVYYLVSKPHSK